MLIEFDARHLGDCDVPSEWAGGVRPGAAGLTLIGDRTGFRELFVYCGSTSGAAATSLGELLDHLDQSGVSAELSPFGISSALHHGLVPFPHTEYEGIYSLSMGDLANVAVRDGSLSIELSNEYPWTEDRSSDDGDPSEKELLRLLTASTERQLATVGNEGFLMLSSGKDSPALALALAEAGFDHIPCVTYSSGAEDPEPPIAAGICRRLGLQHQIVQMPDSQSEIATTLTAFFEASPRPGVDLSQIPYALAAAASGITKGAVLDGCGNDYYMGYPPTGHDVTKPRFRIRGRMPAVALQRIFPVDSPVNYFARSRAEVTLPGRTMRPHHGSRLYADAVDTSRYWYEVSKETRGLSLIDLYAAVHVRHTGPGGSLQKLRLVANSIGMSAALPWCDDHVADYYFNLQERYRYDRKSGKNKLLLRKMLYRYLDYDADAVGKHYFEFDGPGFLDRNDEYVRSEINGCALWDDDGLRLVNQWLDRVGSRPLLYHALLTIFMVSGWHNQSRYLNRSGSGNGSV